MEIFKRGLIVSCQALVGEPLHGDNTMSKMALAAKMGGAIGLRLNGVEDIINVSKVVDLPKIGIIKRVYEGYDVFITPTIREIEELVQAKPEVIALDCTFRKRPGFDCPVDFIKHIKKNYDVKLMADISNFEEGVAAAEAGVDYVGTTLSGYTSYTQDRERPDIELIEKLAKTIKVPIIAEGNVMTPEDAVRALNAGAHAVVVGGAITRPQQITQRFTKEIDNFL